MQASPQAEESRQPAQETARPESSWLLMDLYICLAGFIVALAGKPQLYVKNALCDANNWLCAPGAALGWHVDNIKAVPEYTA